MWTNMVHRYVTACPWLRVCFGVLRLGFRQLSWMGPQHLEWKMMPRVSLGKRAPRYLNLLVYGKETTNVHSPPSPPPPPVKLHCQSRLERWRFVFWLRQDVKMHAYGICQAVMLRTAQRLGERRLLQARCLTFQIPDLHRDLPWRSKRIAVCYDS